VKGILAVGDCIVSGVKELRGNSYPERVGKVFNVTVKNCGTTMSSSREGIHLLRDNLSDDFDCVIIQFGVKDSYSSFKYAPNILYYPDNVIRKLMRSIVKKYKKICRNMGLNKRFGEVPVVPETEFRENILNLIHQCRKRHIILPEIIAHQEARRNPSIKQYNSILQELAQSRKNCCFVKLFDVFLENMPEFYLDEGHPNDIGYTYIADEIVRCLAGKNV